MSVRRQIGAEQRSMGALAADHYWQTLQPLCSQRWWQRRPSRLKHGRRCIYYCCRVVLLFRQTHNTLVWAAKAGLAGLPA